MIVILPKSLYIAKKRLSFTTVQKYWSIILKYSSKACFHLGSQALRINLKNLQQGGRQLSSIAMYLTCRRAKVQPPTSKSNNNNKYNLQ